MISMIAAVGHNNIIGFKGKIPWRLKDDMKFFQETTNGHIVIMGRKTWDSLPKSFRPLKNRDNIVVSSSLDDPLVDDNNFITIINNDRSIIHQFSGQERVTLVKTFDIARTIAERIQQKESKKIFVIGGSSAYNFFLPYTSELLITHVNSMPCGDTFFPYVDYRLWRAEEIASGMPNEDNDFSFIITRYTKTLNQ